MNKYIVWGAQGASGNAPQTALPSGGISRDFKALPSSWNATLRAISPDGIDLAASTYEAAVLDQSTQAVEYLIWAANQAHATSLTGNTLNANDLLVRTVLGTVLVGTRTVGGYKDGSTKLAATSEKSIKNVLSCLVKHGGTGSHYLLCAFGTVPPVGNLTDSEGNAIAVTTVPSSITCLNPQTGIITVSTTTLNTLFGGSLSLQRGDTVLQVWVNLSEQTFWWTRNDPYEKRFDYNSKLQRWEPLKGGSVISVGTVQSGIDYQLSPAPSTFAVGDYLFGDALHQDAFSCLRLGAEPNKDSLPIAYDAAPGPGQFSGVVVVAEDSISGFDFTAQPDLAGIVGAVSGQLILNPAFVTAHAGESLWYSPVRFSGQNGLVASILQPLYVAPVPGPNQYPFLRIGSRSYLTCTVFDTDTELLAASDPAEQEVYVSLSTGRVRISSIAIAKATPTSPTFDPAYLGENLFYDGVALNQKPQPLCGAQQLVDSTGAVVQDLSAGDDLYLLAADPFANQGLGMSGVLFVPDKTGAVPVWTNNPPVRPGGEDSNQDAVGLIRQIGSYINQFQLGENVVRTTAQALPKTEIVPYEADLPGWSFTTNIDTAYIAREGSLLGSGAYGSAVKIHDDLRNSGPGYYRDTLLTPSQVSGNGKLVSMLRGNRWTFDGSEVLYFCVDTVPFRWTSTQGTWTLEGVRQSLLDALRINGAGNPDGTGYRLRDLGTDLVLIDRDYLCIKALQTVQIGFGKQTKNLSGNTALGFMPGWRMDVGSDWWCRDTGYSFGMPRSPNNLDQTASTPDYQDTVQLSRVITDSVQGFPFQSLDYAPLRDRPGYGPDQFFRLTAQAAGQTRYQYLTNYVDVEYGFESDRFNWLSQESVTGTITQPTQTLNLGQPQIVAETLLGCEPNPDSSLAVSLDGKAFQQLTQGTDYFLSEGPGSAQLVETVGATLLSGFAGSYTGDILSNTFPAGYPDFSTISVGDRLLIGTEHRVITEVISASQIRVSPAFTRIATGVVWAIYKGDTFAQYDQAILFDAAYVPFNPLPENPLKVRQISLLGKIPANGRLSSVIQSNGTLTVRFGLLSGATIAEWQQSISAHSAQLVRLKESTLGTLKNQLYLQDLTSQHYLETAFTLQIGTTLLTQGIDLVGVYTFTNPTPVNTAEYHLQTGELRFGANLLKNLAGQTVYQVETFLPASSITTGTAEYDATGLIQLAQADIVQTTLCYLCEELTTQEYSVNPVAGAVTLRRGLRAGQVLEVNYISAGLSGESSGTEYIQNIPFYQTRQPAIQIDDRHYQIDKGTHTIDPTVEPTVWVGAVVQNYSEQTAAWDLQAGIITFNQPILEPVLVSYAVKGAFGGEQSLTIPNAPLWNPPFWLGTKVSTFSLDGDRTQDFTTGTLLRLNNQLFWVKQSNFVVGRAVRSSATTPYAGFNVLGQTTITIYPETNHPVGSKNPAQQALCVLSDRPLTQTVDGQTTQAAHAGFLLSVQTPFQPVNRGDTQIVFRGVPIEVAGTTDPLTGVSRFNFVAGMLLNLGGEPYLIQASQTVGDKTILTLASECIRGYDATETVQVSARPIYPTGARVLLPLGGVVQTNPVELIRYADGQPGQTLRNGVDWTLDPQTGVVQINSVQPALLARERFEARWTRLCTLYPWNHNGQTISPIYQTQYRYRTIPSAENGLKGAVLEGKYTFHAPDSFYGSVEPLASYEATFLQDVTRQAQSQTGLQYRGAKLPLNQMGVKSALTQWQEMQVKDRMARRLLSFYNGLIVGFEQSTEMMNGLLVGDRDGKFRFSVPEGYVDTVQPGSEDPVTGTIIPRNVYNEVFQRLAQIVYPVLLGDRIVDPTTVTLSAGLLDGDTPDSSLLAAMLEDQRGLIQNDIDDIVLVGTKRLHLELLFHLYRLGDYKQLWQASQYSRLYPERTKGIFMTQPGLGADLANGVVGEYTPFRYHNGTVESTFLTPIAQVSNPVLENLTSITSISIRARMPRARVWGYYPTGIPANMLKAGQPAINEPCCISVVVDLNQVPVSPVTGFPDCTQFISQGGDLFDLSTGDFEQLSPYWKQTTFGWFAAGNSLAVQFGSPDGTLFGASADTRYPSGALTGLYVKEVLYGCVVTFKDLSGATPTAEHILRMSSDKTGTTLSLSQGDTITVYVRKDVTEDLYQTQNYRNYFDTYTRSSDGQLLDLTLPEFLRDILKQRPPQPMEYLEAQVSFGNTTTEPTVFPALQGKSLLDSGDRSLPYPEVLNTELVRMGQISNAMSDLMLARSPLPNQYYIYPDEILSNDGQLLTTYTGGQPPAVLLVSDPYNPVGVGKGTVQTEDLLLVQTTNAIAGSAQGFQSIADLAVSGGKTQVSVPRFPSRTLKGAEIRYTLDNAMVHVSNAGSVQIIEDRSGGAPNGAAGKYVTLLDFGGVGSITLDDGQDAGLGAAGLGGLNAILAAHPSNNIIIRLYNTANTSEGGVDFLKGDFVEEFVFAQGGCTATVAGVIVPGTVSFGWNNNHKLVRFIPTAMAPGGSLVDLASVATTRFGTITEAPATVWTTDASFSFSVSIVATFGYSDVARIGQDRLTFLDAFDLRHAQPRGYRHPDSGWDLQTKLLVDSIRVKDSGGVLHWVDWSNLNGRFGSIGCPYTFLDLTGTGTLGTFSPASASGAGDEFGSIKVPSWEGVGSPGNAADIQAILTGDQVSGFTIVSGGSGYVGGTVELVLGAPPAGRTATAIATVTSGVITAVTLKLPGNGYVVAPSVTVQHWAGNQSIQAAQNLTVSAIPSSPEDETGTIYTGTATVETDPILTNLSALANKIQPGDICTIHTTTDALYVAANHTGTSLVRHAITPDVLGGTTESLDVTATLGSDSGWCNTQFPQVTVWDVGTGTITLDTLYRFGEAGNTGLPSTPHSWIGNQDWGIFPEPVSYAIKYGVMPRLYLITKLDGAATEVVSMQYIGGTVSTNTFLMVPGSAQDKNGAFLADVDFWLAVQKGLLVSGMVYLPIQLHRVPGLPTDNVVVDLTAGTCGLRSVLVKTAFGSVEYTGAALQDIDVYSGAYAQPNASNLGCNLCIPKTAGLYVETRQEAVYTGVQAILDFSGIVNHADLGAVHSLAGARCLVPGDQIRSANAVGVNTIEVKAGIFLEPSFPVPNQPMVGGVWLTDIFQSVAGSNPCKIFTNAAHGLHVGSAIHIQDHSNTALNGSWLVTNVVAANTIEINYDNTLGLLGVGGSVWGSDQPKLVDRSSQPVAARQVGVRGFSGIEQAVQIDVRRIRRFHDANATVDANFQPLRYAYETRRGRVTGYTTIIGGHNHQIGALSAHNYTFASDDPDYRNGWIYSGTQLGAFTSKDVNIQPGDEVRIIDPSKKPSEQVVARAEVLKVVSAHALYLKSPGVLDAGFLSNPTAYQFQVYLKHTVPHQQSCEQLCELLTSRTVLDVVADRILLKGGYVTIPAGVGAARIAAYDTEVNKLRDDTVSDFRNLGIQVGDIVVIDPAGVVGSRDGVTERGTRPFGDIGISARGVDYQAGRPAPVDDNRGHFWVQEIHQDYLKVSGMTEFAGSRTADKVFPSKPAAQAVRGYTVLPTIHNSAITTNQIEGQGDLRPTQLPGKDDDGALTGFTQSYQDTHYSLRPFSYRIIRPDGKLSVKAINLILTMRERMLSLIELFKGAVEGTHGGDYHDFQELLYGRDLGYSTVATAGQGVFRNALIEDLQGQVGVVPYLNDADCLSVLDRRFWIGDKRLERLTSDGSGYGMVLTPPGTPYADYSGVGSDVRPVLPDRIEQVVDFQDHLRELRYSWISYRVHRVEGSLVQIQRFEQNYQSLQQKITKARMQQKGL